MLVKQGCSFFCMQALYLREVAVDRHLFYDGRTPIINCFNIETFSHLVAVECGRLSAINVEAEESTEPGDIQASSVIIEKNWNASACDHVVSQSGSIDASCGEQHSSKQAQVRIPNALHFRVQLRLDTFSVLPSILCLK